MAWTGLLVLRAAPATARITALVCSGDAAFRAAHMADWPGLGVTGIAKPFALDALLALVGGALGDRQAP